MNRLDTDLSPQPSAHGDTDNAGKVGTSSTVTFTYDLTPTGTAS
jgi:hypothetical protein